MPVCQPCRIARHDACADLGCVCQHRPTQAPEPSGTDGTTHTDESSQP